MNAFLKNNKIHRALIFVLLCSGFAQAGLVSTNAVINSQSGSYSQADLHTAMASAELQEQLQTMGVDVEQLNDRIASLTPDEIQQLNAELEHAPAGGIIDVLLTVFVVFIITDMLCATDIFTFVNCINK